MAITCYAAAIAALLLFPVEASNAAAAALRVWGLQVVPSLFPYMVLSKMLARRLRKTKTPPVLVCAALGMLGGSPSGAAVICAYGDRLSPRTALALTALTGTISPMFFLGAVSQWTGDALLSQRLLICQYMGALFASVCALLAPEEALPASPGALGKTSSRDTPLRQSIDAVLQIGGCIICFSVLASLLSMLPWISSPAAAALHGFLEISGGIHAISAAPISGAMRALLLCAVSGFSGASILAQNLVFTKEIGICAAHLVLLAMLRALGSMAAMAFFL